MHVIYENIHKRVFCWSQWWWLIIYSRDTHVVTVVVVAAGNCLL